MIFLVRDQHIRVSDVDDDATQASIKEAFTELLVQSGLGKWEAHDVAARVRIERVWWSDTMGFTHNCQTHEEVGTKRNPTSCPNDAHEDVVILDVPPLALAEIEEEIRRLHGSADQIQDH